MISLLKIKKKYTQDEIDYISSKIPDIEFYLISDGLREFWLEWREKNEK
jgi:hypothetical protein